ncbi:mechanosensitive ion channel protein MscS, partial [Halorubrum ezzemoulense]
MISGLGARAGAVLSGISSTEGRLAVTAAIALGTLAVGWLLLPKAVRAGERTASGWIERLVDERLAESTEGAIETLRDGVPSSFLLRLAVGVLQLGLFALAGVAVLTLWGRFDVVVAVSPVAENALTIGAQIVVSAVLLGGAYVVSDVIEAYVADLSADSDRITAHQEQLLTRLAQVGLLVLAGITVLGVWGVNLGGLLVGAGFLGIVLGMAARQTLGSLLAGFVLMFSRPFEIGDWVEIGSEEGFVTDITIMNTHMRNFDGEYVVVPNDLVANQAITNR